MRRFAIIAAIQISILVLCSSVYAMSFQWQLSPAGNQFGLIIKASGAIDSGDSIGLAAILRNADSRSSVIQIDSPGGNVETAIVMAKLIHKHRVHVIVTGDCISACASVLFPSGITSQLASGKLLGFHTCYSSQDRKAHPECNRVVADLAVEHGFSYGSVLTWTGLANADQIYWVGEVEARCFGYYNDGTNGRPIDSQKPCVIAFVSLSIEDLGTSFDGRSSGPSFDCKNARSDIEHLICYDKPLAYIDRLQGAFYSLVRSKANPDKRKALLTDQRKWLKNRDRDCKKAARNYRSYIESRAGVLCIYRHLEKRMLELAVVE